MSYRNDHDAAIARVDALQREVAQLKVEAALKLVSLPKPPIRPGVVRLATLATATLTVLAGIAIAGEEPAADPTPAVATLDTRVNRAALDACIDAIRPLPQQLTAPRLSPADIAAVEATGAPCRLEIREFAREGLWSPLERDALASWAEAEDRLANTISMIGVYHRDDPFRLDGGSTAGQLWSEYARAHAQRDAAIGIWRRTR